MPQPPRSPSASEVVILPGQENVIADVFGRGAVLPGNYRWLDGRIDKGEISCRYDSPGGTVVVTCVVRENAASGAVLTECFALTVTQGNPSPELLATIAARLREREAGIQMSRATSARAAAAFEKHLHAPLELRTGMRILEIGAGEGVALLELAARAREANVRAEFIAVDKDTTRSGPFTQAASARGLLDMTRFESANAWQLPPHLGRFDVVLCLGCVSLFAVGRTDPLDSLFWHWSSFMRPGARMVIAEVDRQATDEHQARAVALYERRKWPLIPAAEIDAALEKAGFAPRVAKRSLHFRTASLDDAERYLGFGLPIESGDGDFAPDISPPAGEHYDFIWHIIEALHAPPA